MESSKCKEIQGQTITEEDKLLLISNHGNGGGFSKWISGPVKVTKPTIIQ